MNALDRNGLLVAIEGVDGSGKATQVELLVEKLKKEGYKVKDFAFPRYGEPAAVLVERYLDGFYGPPWKVDPYKASVLYAVDRFDASHKIRSHLEEGGVVVADRYVNSNMAHQGAKFSSPESKTAFFAWLSHLEYQVLDAPKPDLNIFLNTPVEVAWKWKKDMAGENDLKEKNREYQEKVHSSYEKLVNGFGEDFTFVEVVENEEVFSKEDIFSSVWQKVEPLLP